MIPTTERTTSTTTAEKKKTVFLLFGSVLIFAKYFPQFFPRVVIYSDCVIRTDYFNTLKTRVKKIVSVHMCEAADRLLVNE